MVLPVDNWEKGMSPAAVVVAARDGLGLVAAWVASDMASARATPATTPATNGPVVGTAPKGTRFKVSKRDGDWIQVESDRLKGWINSQFLGPNNPR
jgi:uncharacterized protein YraI